MTSLAFFFGVLPLALATGAGAGAMKAIGTAVTGGMLSATFIDLFYIPLFFVLVSRTFKAKERMRPPIRHFGGKPVMIRNALASSLPLVCLAGCTMVPRVFAARRRRSRPSGRRVPPTRRRYEGQAGACRTGRWRDVLCR